MLHQLRAVVSVVAALIAGSVHAENFSAQDVMTLCMTTPSDIEQIPTILQSRGWLELNQEDLAKHQDDVTIAYLAAGYFHANLYGGTQVAPQSWQDAWTRLEGSHDLREKNDRLFGRSENGALLVFSNHSRGPVLDYRCLLAVPRDILKQSSYFPKLREPTAPALSLVIGEFLFSKSIRSSFRIQSASIDTDGINKLLGISATIGAAFESSMKYPMVSVSP
jgi:hypothetical protein